MISAPPAPAPADGQADGYGSWPPELVEDRCRNTMNGRVGSMLVSETERVRVWHISIDPGERLTFHRHVLDYFWTALAPGRARSYYDGGDIRDYDYQTGDTAHFAFAPGEYMLHNLVNVGATQLRFVTVEFKGSANPPLDLETAAQGRDRPLREQDCI